MPRRLALTLAALLCAAPLLAQQVPGDDLDPPTCKSFMERDMDGRISVLTTIEPFGDEIDISDRRASEEWANEVASACMKKPGRTLGEAAQAAEAGL